MTRRGVTSLIRRLRGAGDPLVAPSEPDYTGVSSEDRPILEQAFPYTMIGIPRLQACIDAVRYCQRRNVPGDFAECGVWRGGSVLAMILTLQSLGADDRDFYLYDTFEGMTRPTEWDTSSLDGPALEVWEAAQHQGSTAWPEVFGPGVFDEAKVRETLLATGYPEERLHLVRGPVEETLPARAPDRLALLRLDTDWYESTRHELIHLYPRLSTGGVLLIDDYGHWEGCARAVDEYLDEHEIRLLLTRTDYTGRMAVKH